jgi:hypothetical protein
MFGRIAAMVHDNTLAGSHSAAGSHSGRPIIERLMKGRELRVSNLADANGEPAVICETQGEMSQQSSEAAHGRDSMPQKLLQLVGCRDPKAGSDPWRRPLRNGGR